MRHGSVAILPALAAVTLSLVACRAEEAPGTGARSAAPSSGPAVARQEDGDSSHAHRRPRRDRWVTRRPAWLGTRVLPERADGFAVPQRTPPLLRNRRLATIDLLDPPGDRLFHARISPVPRDVAARSSWRARCPVDLSELRYLRLTFWGFDHRPHTGEMIVNAAVARDVTSVFRALFEARFPIEEMRIVARREMDAPPTGDTNVTSSFECRRTTLGSSWSQHAYGLAVDINPFHNPYVRGDLVVPELATAYADRSWERPGMISEGGVAVVSFDALGWGWGGRWHSLKDYMHFSLTGR